MMRTELELLREIADEAQKVWNKGFLALEDTHLANLLTDRIDLMERLPSDIDECGTYTGKILKIKMCSACKWWDWDWCYHPDVQTSDEDAREIIINTSEPNVFPFGARWRMRQTPKNKDENTVERILAEVWLDADNGEWPKENAGQRKVFVELTFTELKGE